MKKPRTTGGESLRFKLKLFITIFYIALDIGLNSSVEHDTIELYDTEQQNMESAGDILALMLGVQLMVQVGVFVSLFLVMYDTYPLRVGLAEMLTSKYLTVCIVNVIYFLMTAMIYGYRATRMMQDIEMRVWQVWDLSGYLPLSILHKITATVYYITNIRAVLTLGDPMFYSKQAWVSMYFDHRGQELGGDSGRVDPMFAPIAKI